MDLHAWRPELRPRGCPLGRGAAPGHGRFRARGLCRAGPRAVRHHLGAPHPHRARAGRRHPGRPGRAALCGAPGGADHGTGAQHRAARLGAHLCAAPGCAQLPARLGAARRPRARPRVARGAGARPRPGGPDAPGGAGGGARLRHGAGRGRPGHRPGEPGGGAGGGGAQRAAPRQGLPDGSRPRERRAPPHEGPHLREGLEL